MSEIILILSYAEDTTAQRVIHALRRQGADVLFFDTSFFPLQSELDATFAGSSWQGVIRYEGRQYDLAHIKSVFVRRPMHYVVDQTAPEPVRAFLENEALKGFGGILRSLNHILWMNPLDANRAANFKPVQLQVAAQAGLRVPHSLITNDPDAVRRFYAECNGNIVYKTLHGGGVAGGGHVAHTIFTSLVTPESLQHLERVKLTAHYFQEYIHKDIELRVTVIGQAVLAVAIHSQEVEDSRVDWRASPRKLGYSIYDLPEAVANQCVQLTRILGLTYGALDLVITPEQEYVFLECNPGGQYEWLGVETGLPFSSTIADVLLGGKERLYEDN